MRLKKFLGITAFLVGLAAAFSCSRLPTVGQNGGTSTSENGQISGVIVDSTGSPAAGAQVLLIPDNYNPVRDSLKKISHSGITDSNGFYSFSSLDEHYYNLLVSHLTKRTKAIITNIPIISESINQPKITLQKTGSVTIRLPDSVNYENGYVYILGTNIHVKVKNAIGNMLVIDSLPIGTLPTLYYNTENNSDSGQIRLADNLVVFVGDTSKIGFSAWEHYALLYFNTTPSGANVASAIVNFPALVRLTKDNFDFSQAQGDGKDIRFAKPDNSPLPYEIEQWDSVAGAAAIWVKIDTVYGNSGDQYIRMHWGNSNALDSSISAAVFDTSTGFQGVWHMGQGRYSIIKDATKNRFDATPKGLQTPHDTDGYIGKCQSFSGTSGYLEMEHSANSALNFVEDGFYSIAAWVYTDMLDDLYHSIVSKGNEQYGLQINKSNYWEFFEYQNAKGWDSTVTLAKAKSWNYIVGVRQSQNQFLYVNGVCVDSTIKNVSGTGPRITDQNVCIGKRSGLYDTLALFRGKIDEVSMMNRSSSPDWIKLSYMNQKLPDGFVTIKPKK